MLARLPSLMLVRLWAALLFAAIGLQAAEPFAAPLEQKHGSAFSATTYEMALSPRRSQEIAVQAPLLMPLAEAEIEITPPAPQVLGQLFTRPDSTGPPLSGSQVRRPAPRAPPIA